MTASEDERAGVRGSSPHPRGELPELDQRSEHTSAPVGADGTDGGPIDGESTDDFPAESPAEGVPASAEESETPDAAVDSKGRTPPRPVKKTSFWKELPILIGIALVLTFLIQTFIARVYVIPSGSMEQTLNGCPGCTGDRILVDKLTYDFTDPSPGDVVVFKGPPGWAQSEFNVTESSNVVVRWVREFGSSIGIGAPPEYDLVKRVIAVGGQTVSCCDSQNRVLVDGKPLNESYIYWMPGMAAKQPDFAPVKIPQGDLWVMGDNRNDSYDSRFQNGGGINGVVPVNDVIGIARTIIWPPNRWRGIGELNPQALSLSLGDPQWQVSAPPLGVGALAAWPTLWFGRRTLRGLRDRAGNLRRRSRPPGGERR
jgi:signal peptidase I